MLTMRTRLILSFALVVAVTIGTILLIARQMTASEVRTFMFRGGMTGSTGLVNQLEKYYNQNDSWSGVETLFNNPGQGKGMGAGGGMMNQRFRLADGDGTVIIDTGSQGTGDRLSSQERNIAIQLTSDGRTIGFLLPEGGASFSNSDESNLVKSLNKAATSAALIAGGIALILALLLAYRLLKPVRALTHAADGMAAGDLSQRVSASGNDELAILGRTFNHMADSLQTAEESRQALTADIAHELRTPLAVQRAQIEAIQDGIYELTPDKLASIEAQNHLLTRLVDDLRTLALADGGHLALEKTSTDLIGLINRVINRFTAQAQQQSITFTFQHSERCPSIIADHQRIEQILNNLLSNAIRYTPAGKTIDLHLTCKHREVTLQVHDNGEGIPEAALPYLFERFYRADKSRARDAGGTGLGLSIARKLAVAHGGDLSADNHPDGGAVFTLTLPV